jgi:hypothetical protein
MFLQKLMSSTEESVSSRISNGCTDKDSKSEDNAFAAFNLLRLKEFNSEKGNLVLCGKMRDETFS